METETHFSLRMRAAVLKIQVWIRKQLKGSVCDHQQQQTIRQETSRKIIGGILNEHGTSFRC